METIAQSKHALLQLFLVWTQRNHVQIHLASTALSRGSLDRFSGPPHQWIFRAHPEHLLERLMGDPERTLVVIDEIQKVPTLLDVIHRLIEEQRNVRFVLTGSSARKLRRGASNLLAGRLLQAEMHPFLASELGKDFELQQALRFGLIPLIWQAEDPAATLQAYVDLYLRGRSASRVGSGFGCLRSLFGNPLLTAVCSISQP